MGSMKPRWKQMDIKRSKFALYNALLGLLIGLFVTYTAIGDGYEVLIIAIPVSFFLINALCEKYIIKDWTKASGIRVLVAISFSTVLSHYFTFILLIIGANLCYWITNSCTSSMGEAPAAIIDGILYGWGPTLFSLIFFGWITMPFSIVLGFILKYHRTTHTT